MTYDIRTNIHAVAGSAIGARSKPEIEITEAPRATASLEEASAATVRSIEWQLNGSTDVVSATKYLSTDSVATVGAGCLSVDPIKGQMVFANGGNEETPGILRADQANDQLYSSCSSTTLGSTDINTVNGKEFNKQSTQFPSSFFTPVKSWVDQFLSVLSDKRLIYVAFIEGISLALLATQRRTDSSQIESRTTDLGTIIVDNQEFEDRMLRI